VSESEILDLVLGSIVIVVVTGAIFELIGYLIASVVRRGGGRPSTIVAIRDGIRVIWLAIAVAGVVGYTGLASALTILTISGVAGLVVSLALQASLTNMIAGILLLNDRLLSLGDTIEYGAVKGTIVRVALRNTWVLLDSGRIAVIGNGQLANGPLINHSATARLTERYRF
jgi:small conductance mechanosensitive channel